LARGMSTAWEGDEPRSTGWTRREWAKLALAAGAASSVLAMGGTVAGQLLPPPAKFQGELRQEIYYTKWPRPTWWDDRQGRPILATDFQEWQGASGVWRGLFVNERWVPGTTRCSSRRMCIRGTACRSSEPRMSMGRPSGLSRLSRSESTERCWSAECRILGGTITVEGSGPCPLLRRSGPDAIGSERASSPEPRPVPARWWEPRPILSFSLRPLVRRESYASRSCIFHSPRTSGGIASRGRTSA